jgi:hypothetical protein
MALRPSPPCFFSKKFGKILSEHGDVRTTVRAMRWVTRKWGAGAETTEGLSWPPYSAAMTSFFLAISIAPIGL